MVEEKRNGRKGQGEEGGKGRETGEEECENEGE